MKSSQSRLLDTQYILEYQPSPALVGQDTLCKPLQTQDGYCDSLFGQGGLSKPTVWAVAAESAVSQPIHAPRRQLQAHDVTPALQLTVEGVLLRTPLAPSGPHRCTSYVSAPVPKQKAVDSRSHAPESRAIDQLLLQHSARESHSSHERLSDSESTADPAHQHHIQQPRRAQSQQSHEHAICQQPKSAAVWQGCNSGKLKDDRFLAGGAAVRLPNLHLHNQHEPYLAVPARHMQSACC
ncbi:TPA: hypothetical protein ACH3X1_003158 [Trebouxia sp. C0004]